LDQTPTYDEFFHILTAKEWLQSGNFQIGDGVYERAKYFTALVAGFIKLFGDSFVVYRLPSLIAGTLWVTTIFYWVYREVGVKEAWIAGLIMAIAPEMIFLSQFARFYAIHGLCFFIGVIALYYLFSHTNKWSVKQYILSGSIAVLSLLLARHFQLTTLLGLGGVVVWLFIIKLTHFIKYQEKPKLIWTLVLLGVSLVFGALFVFYTDAGLALWENYRKPLYWAQADASNYMYYRYVLTEQYQVIWLLLPVIVLVSLARRYRPALFSATLFCFVIVLHSFAGTKGERYIQYAMPFLFILFAITIPVLYGYLKKIAGEVYEYTFGTTVWVSGYSKTVSHIIALLVIAYIFVMNSAIMSGVKMALSKGSENPDWALIVKEVQKHIDTDTTVLTSEAAKTLYYFKSYDYEVNDTAVHDADGVEFAINTRLGKPAVGSIESIRNIVSCHDKGIFITEKRRFLNAPRIVRPEVRDYVLSHMTKVENLSEPRIFVFVWKTEPNDLVSCIH
jgi:hypothetical protein